MTSPVAPRLLARNALQMLVAQAAPIVFGILTVPLLARGLGPEAFGLFGLVWVVFGYFAAFDLGLGRATTKHVAGLLGQGKTEDIAGLFWAAVAAQAILGVAAGLGLMAATPVLIERVLHAPAELVPQARAAFFLLSVFLPLVLVAGPFGGVLEAAQRFDLISIVRVASGASSALFPILGLLLGFKLPAIVALILIARAATFVGVIVLTLRVVPSLRRMEAHFARLPGLLAFGAWMAISNLLGPVLLYLDRFLIASALTIAAVAYYTGPFEIALRLWIVPSSLLIALFPAFSALAANHEDLRHLFLRSVKYQFLITVPMFLSLFALAPEVIYLLLGPQYLQPATPVFRILLVGATVGALAPLANSLLQATGRPDILAKLYVAYLPLYVGATWVLVRAIGITGAALTTSARSLLDTVILSIIAWRLLRMRRANLREYRFGYLALLFAGVSAALLAAAAVPALGFRAAAVTGTLLVCAALAWRHVLDDEDRKVLREALPGAARVFGRSIRGPFVRMQQRRHLRRHYPATTSRLIVFLTPGYDSVSGGILSIASLYIETANLSHMHRAAVALCTVPGEPTLMRYTRFTNSNHMYTLSDILARMPHLRSLLIHIPEYAAADFLDRCTNGQLARLSHIADLRFNVMLQNVDLLPPPDELARFLQYGRLTCTSAHRAYSTRAMEEYLGCPLHELSVYISPELYDRKPYDQKDDLMIVSPDPHPMRDKVLSLLADKCPRLRLVTIQNVTYEKFKALAASAKWSLTFGEGLDGYFVETVFSGGIAFGVFNERFFTEDFRGLRTVYTSYETMLQCLSNDIRALDQHDAYVQYHEVQHGICAQLYDYRNYTRNLSSYYERYFAPEGAAG